MGETVYAQNKRAANKLSARKYRENKKKRKSKASQNIYLIIERLSKCISILKYCIHMYDKERKNVMKKLNEELFIQTLLNPNEPPKLFCVYDFHLDVQYINKADSKSEIHKIINNYSRISKAGSDAQRELMDVYKDTILLYTKIKAVLK